MEASEKHRPEDAADSRLDDVTDRSTTDTGDATTENHSDEERALEKSSDVKRFWRFLTLPA